MEPKWIFVYSGGIGYAIYIGSLWSLDRGGPDSFVIAAGAILGVGAALLWAAQGIVVMSYPLEKDRSRHFAYQVSFPWAPPRLTCDR